MKKGAGKKDTKRIISFCVENEGLTGAKESMEKYAAKAKEHLSLFSQSPEKENAYKFVDYVIGRNK
jgi:geranylgeranyl pyrophosphate synthase